MLLFDRITQAKLLQQQYQKHLFGPEPLGGYIPRVERDNYEYCALTDEMTYTLKVWFGDPIGITFSYIVGLKRGVVTDYGFVVDGAAIIHQADASMKTKKAEYQELVDLTQIMLNTGGISVRQYLAQVREAHDRIRGIVRDKQI